MPFIDPLARVAAHLGCIVPRASPLGRASAGSFAGVPVHDRSRASLPDTRLWGPSDALDLAKPAWNLGWSRDRYSHIHSGFS